ncbi:hypothetical protein [Marivita cryptomonadis]|uniref:Uncharacterized protein n=1 Tax=Marivita cryptomonadis TaxID=505252 RepID=A0A9Q2NY61_9RHOB|nr:hypothetical protein [Marivita cryptomonadis]MBM2411871.1 hypothetical protein [Marivita cryptomonadis]
MGNATRQAIPATLHSRANTPTVKTPTTRRRAQAKTAARTNDCGDAV